MAFTFKTKPTGVWANFTTDCQICNGEIIYRDGRQERHECRERIDLDQTRPRLEDIQFPDH